MTLILLITWAVVAATVGMTIATNIRIRRTRRTALAVHRFSTAIIVDKTCDHGQPVFALHLRDHHGQHITAVIPRCAAAELTGSLLALVHRHEGTGAHQEFSDDIAAAAAQAFDLITIDLPPCCDAGTRTGGREHTCDQKRT